MSVVYVFFNFEQSPSTAWSNPARSLQPALSGNFSFALSPKSGTQLHLTSQNCSLLGVRSLPAFSSTPAGTEVMFSFSGVMAETLLPQILQKERYRGWLDWVQVSAYVVIQSDPLRRADCFLRKMLAQCSVLPPCRLKFSQWQTTLQIGSPVTVNLMALQRQWLLSTVGLVGLRHSLCKEE